MKKKIITLIILTLFCVSPLSFICVKGITSPTWSVESGSPDEKEILYDCDDVYVTFTGSVNITNNDVKENTFNIEAILYVDNVIKETDNDSVIISSSATEVVSLSFICDMWFGYDDYGSHEWFILVTLTDSALTFSETKNTQERITYVTNIGGYTISLRIWNPTDGELLPCGDVEFKGSATIVLSSWSGNFIYWNYESKINGQILDSGSDFTNEYEYFFIESLIDTGDYSYGDYHNYSISLYNVYISTFWSEETIPIPSKSLCVSWHREPKTPFDWTANNLNPSNYDILYNCDENIPIFSFKVDITNTVGQTVEFTTKTSLFIDRMFYYTDVWNSKIIEKDETETIIVNISCDIFSYRGFGNHAWEAGIDLYVEPYSNVRDRKITDFKYVYIADYDQQIYCNLTKPQNNEVIPYEENNPEFSGIIYFKLINASLPEDDYWMMLKLEILVDNNREFVNDYWIYGSTLLAPFKFHILAHEYGVGKHTCNIEMSRIEVQKSGGSIEYPDMTILSFNWYLAEELPVTPTPTPSPTPTEISGIGLIATMFGITFISTIIVVLKRKKPKVKSEVIKNE